MTYAPNFNCFFGEVSRMFSPYSLLCSKEGHRGGSQAGCVETAGILSSCPNVHSGTRLAPGSQHVTLGHSLTFTTTYHHHQRAQPTHITRFCPQDNYNPSAPLAFSNIRSGKPFSVSTCYFPPDVPATTMSTVLGSRDFLQKCDLGMKA